MDKQIKELQEKASKINLLFHEELGFLTLTDYNGEIIFRCIDIVSINTFIIGYEAGYEIGKHIDLENEDGYQNGYKHGYKDGFDDGYQEGQDSY